MDILLLTIPKVTFTQVQAACPILKGIIKSHNYSCEVYDCNIEFYKTFRDTGKADYLSDYFLAHEKEKSIKVVFFGSQY